MKKFIEMCKKCIQHDSVQYEKAKKLALSGETLLIARFQRKLSIGYNRVAHLFEALEHECIITRPNKDGKRELVKL